MARLTRCEVYSIRLHGVIHQTTFFIIQALRNSIVTFFGGAGGGFFNELNFNQYTIQQTCEYIQLHTVYTAPYNEECQMYTLHTNLTHLRTVFCDKTRKLKLL